MGVDAFDVRAAVGRGVRQQRKHGLLGIAGAIHPHTIDAACGSH